MFLSDIAKKINVVKIVNQKNNKYFNKITSFSKEVNKNTIFIINSKKKITKEYIKEAIKNKAPAIISNQIYNKVSLTQFAVNNFDKEIKKLLYSLKPKKPLNSIAITGTNGKTSVAWYVSEICSLNNISIKMQGTLGYYINGRKKKSNILTTPNYETLHQNSYSKLKNKFNFIFEASSHSLQQGRIKSYPIDIAAITNISHDHLDYHKSFFNYKNAKFKLFKKYLKTKKTAIINSRIKFIKTLIKNLKKRNIRIILYGKKDIYFKYIKKELILNIFDKSYKITNLNLSEIDKQNIECAIACCLHLKISPKNIIKSLIKIRRPPGRSEIIKINNISSKVIIDYAHTPEALKKILKANTKNNKKPDLVFGCGGNRDKTKRKLMGKISDKFARKVFITDDNPRNENPKFIRSEILKYCPRGLEIPSRKFAIREAIINLKRNSILIIAGKGHEKIQILRNKIINFDDFKVAKNIIKKN